MQTVIITVLERILRYLEPLLPTANCHMVDFFIDNIYEKHVSHDIREELLKIPTENVLNTIWGPSETCPELYKFIKSTKSHTLPFFPEVCSNVHDFEQVLINFGCTNLSGFHLETFMTSKKCHEVEILSEIASAVSQISNITHIVDIGDGKGYLSSALAIHSKLNVLGIDSSTTNTIGAAKRIQKMNKILGKKSIYDNKLYKQTTKYVTEETDINQLIMEYFPETNINNIGLVGLHTCGDLAPSCLQIFTTHNYIKTICNVGCCYHLMNEMDDDETNSSGFPLSRYLKERKLKLGRNARMTAAQAVDRIIHQKEKPSDILFYRSLLQVYLYKNAPHLIECRAGRFKKPTDFVNYVYKSLKKWNSDLLPVESELVELYNEYLPKKVELEVFYLLRAHLAAVIESVILLDRLLYLHEMGFEKSYLVQLFDPVISPRCYGLISIK